MEQRIAWDALPGPLKQAIEARTGPITGRILAMRTAHPGCPGPGSSSA
jgi:hypothetical protein